MCQDCCKYSLVASKDSLGSQQSPQRSKCQSKMILVGAVKYGEEAFEENLTEEVIFELSSGG